MMCDRLSLMPNDSSQFETKLTYPLQLGLRAQKLVQGAFVYRLLLNTAVKLYVESISNPQSNLRDKLLEEGLSEQGWNYGLKCMEDYKEMYHDPMLLDAILSMTFNWDAIR